MRAVFTVEIPPTNTDSYPPNEEFLSILRALGWEDTKSKDLSNEEKLEWYVQQAGHLWEEMPEIAAEEKDYVIYYGRLQHNHTKFIVTRVIEGQATFRLLQPNLDRLQASTYDMVQKLIKPPDDFPPLKISNQRVSIYERGHDDIIIHGRVIPSAFREALKIDKRNILLAAGAFLLFVPAIIALFWINSQTNRIIGGTLERSSTAFLTTMIVSAIGFIQTYLEIRSYKLIDWAVAASLQRP